MDPSLASRAVAALTAVLVVGGLLLMHGIEPPAATAGGHGTPVASASHAVIDSAHSHGNLHEGHAAAALDAAAARQGVVASADAGCTTCGLLGHGVLVCVAVLGAVVGSRVLRRVVSVLRLRTAAAVAAAPGRVFAVFSRVHRPPRPVWVELAVMRC